MDAAGVIREANLAAEELLGHERGFLAGKPLSVFFRERDTGNLRDQMCRAGAEQRSRVWSAWLHARGRENPVPVSITLVPIIDRRASAVTGFRLMLQDLTEMMAVRDHVRDLEDGLLRRVTERTMRLTEEVERLKQMVARYVERHGPLAEEEQSAPFAEPKVGAPGGNFAGGGGTKIEGSGETEYFWRVGTDSTADGETRR
jgi:PAS domain S-box-containing protein